MHGERRTTQTVSNVRSNETSPHKVVRGCKEFVQNADHCRGTPHNPPEKGENRVIGGNRIGMEQGHRCSIERGSERRIISIGGPTGASP